MNVLIVNGSPRREGVCSRAIGILKETLHGLAGIAIKEVNAYEQVVAPCLGCLRCRQDKKCALPEDDGHAFAKHLEWCDFIIAASPTYWGNMTGKARMLFERTVPAIGNMNGKKAVLITACGAPFPFYYASSQASTTLRSMKDMLTSGGVKVVKKVIIGNTNRSKTLEREIRAKIKNMERVFG